MPLGPALQQLHNSVVQETFCAFCVDHNGDHTVQPHDNRQSRALKTQQVALMCIWRRSPAHRQRLDNMTSPYLPGGLVMAELAQEVDLLDQLPVIEAQVEDPVHHRIPINFLRQKLRHRYKEAAVQARHDTPAARNGLSRWDDLSAHPLKRAPLSRDAAFLASQCQAKINGRAYPMVSEGFASCFRCWPGWAVILGCTCCKCTSNTLRL